MIADTLQNAEQYYALNKWFKTAFDFLQKLSPQTSEGTYEIAPGLKAMVSEYETMPEFPFGWESHRRYIDIQLCLAGSEHIKCTQLSEALSPTADYNDQKDVRFYTGKVAHTLATVGNGVFAIFFPHDAHAPQIMIGQPARVKKVVIKVPVE